MLAALAIAVTVASPKTFETYVVSLAYDGPVRLVVNGVRVDEPIGKRVDIEHFVVPGANQIFIEPADAKQKTPAVMGEVRLVLGRTDSRSWESADGQVIATMKRGSSIFSVPKELREPLWRIGHPLDDKTDVTYRAKVNELQGLLAAKKVDRYLAQFEESYAETERLFPMVKADDLKKRDVKALEELLEKSAVAPIRNELLIFDHEGAGHLLPCLVKGTRETFRIGDTPVLLRLMKVNGALRPYAAIKP